MIDGLVIKKVCRSERGQWGIRITFQKSKPSNKRCKQMALFSHGNADPPS